MKIKITKLKNFAVLVAVILLASCSKSEPDGSDM